jgi:hypothetical protein
VQIGAVTGGQITLRADVLRSTPIEMMGSGLGSVPGPRFVAAIRAVFAAAKPAGLQVATRAVPLAEIESAWTLAEGQKHHRQGPGTGPRRPASGTLIPIHLVHGGQGSLPLKTRTFLDYCVPRLRAALADLLPADAAVLTGDLSSS